MLDGKDQQIYEITGADLSGIKLLLDLFDGFTQLPVGRC
jgi:hypothetical protein